MSITYIKGDLLTSDAFYIAHGVNCGGVMGSGVALQIKEKYPEVYEDYRQFSTLRHPMDLLGCVRKSAADGKIILNCYTQLHYGRTGQRFVSYDAVDDCMKTIQQIMMDAFTPKAKLAMPKIGAGLGGGQWPVIEEIIKYQLAPVIDRVEVWEL